MTTPEDAEPGNQGDAQGRPEPRQLPGSPFAGGPLRSWHDPHKDDPKPFRRASDGETLPVAPSHIPPIPDTPRRLKPIIRPAALTRSETPSPPAVPFLADAEQPADDSPVTPAVVHLKDVEQPPSAPTPTATAPLPLHQVDQLPASPIPPTSAASSPATSPPAAPGRHAPAPLMPAPRAETLPAPEPDLIIPPALETHSSPAHNAPTAPPAAEPRTLAAPAMVDPPRTVPPPQVAPPPAPSTLAPPSSAVPPNSAHPPQQASALTPLRSPDRVRVRESMAFAVTMFGRNSTTFILLGLTYLGVLLFPTLADLGVTISFAWMSAPEPLRAAWSVIVYGLSLICQIGLFVVAIATFCAAHQACNGNHPTLRTAFRNLPWGPSAACGVIATLVFCAVLIPAEFIALMGVVADPETRGAMLYYFEIESNEMVNPAAKEQWSLFGEQLFGHLLTVATLTYLAVVIVFSLIFLYLFPAVTSGVDTGVSALGRSPSLVFRNFGSSLTLLVLCTLLQLAGLMFLVLPLFLVALPVCAIALTHAYRVLRGLPVIARPSHSDASPQVPAQMHSPSGAPQ